jgi:1-acyl-sn-glycerol-3-phosphate acyltransferase
MKELLKWIIYKRIPTCFSYTFFKLYGRLEVRGIENIPKEGGILIAANHLSYVDPPLLGTVINRRCRFMAKQELFCVPLLRYIVNYYAFPVHRKNPGASSIKIALQELESGKVVIIFPNGSRSAASSVNLKNGIGMIAVLSRKKVIPTLIEGTDKFLSRGSVIPSPAKIRVTFGEPMDVSHAGTDYPLISQMIMDRIEKQK